MTETKIVLRRSRDLLTILILGVMLAVITMPEPRKHHAPKETHKEAAR